MQENNHTIIESIFEKYQKKAFYVNAAKYKDEDNESNANNNDKKIKEK